MTHQTSHTGRNRLAAEKSPYLLQHADNPVDWYPWGDEAFETAVREDKPVFLSIGYSTCHWCHVMEHESFEDSTVAALMNDAFINVKVDREERPDIDNVYMMAAQLVTGGGGWPLTVIMTPDKKPFFVATYIPRDNRYGRTGMLQLIPQIQAAWRDRRDEIHQHAQKITEGLGGMFDRRAGDEPLGADVLSAAFDQMSQRYDEANGGFGSAPKFPTPHNLLFLLRYWKRTGNERALEMVEQSLERMAAGGIYDHLGYGFHRYSTDQKWFAPHFEKMLYDQALLVMAYTEAYLATGKDDYKRVAEEVIHYVLRDMTDEKGAFYSAEDADSEGIEGKFYLWTESEIVDLLGTGEGRFFVDLFGVEPQGNFSEEIAAANILFLRRPLAAVAKEKGVTEDDLRDRTDACRQTLLAARGTRPRPYKDDKILTDWNGLMIAALAKAARAFDNADYAGRAGRAADFILEEMRDRDGRLIHRYRDGEAAKRASIDDYAFFVWGLIELYEATFDIGRLKTAIALTTDMRRDFWDTDNGGFWFTPQDGEQLIVRVKEIYDGAVPSGNSVAALNLLRLGRMTADAELEELASQIGRVFHADVTRGPSAHTLLMAAVDFGVGPSYEVVIVGDPGGTDTRDMRNAIYQRYLPSSVILFKPNDSDGSDIEGGAEFVAPHRAIDGRATAYVCMNYACKLPTTVIADMLGLLGESTD
ncbi:MAG: thioredoxin domain-containing protein [Candidatus Latescibacterota bacterium]|nr:MAG: thioredoxin domain-containing protein [Candidatus Latescibacterota bacterium]